MSEKFFIKLRLGTENEIYNFGSRKMVRLNKILHTNSKLCLDPSAITLIQRVTRLDLSSPIHFYVSYFYGMFAVSTIYEYSSSVVFLFLGTVVFSETVTEQ